MNNYQRALRFFCLCVTAFPFLLHAQHTGNTCAVSKSPYRVAMDSGRVIYAGYCSACHQPDGLGKESEGPALNGKTSTSESKKLLEVFFQSKAHEKITGKNAQDITPPGTMLTDVQMADVLTYIRNSFGNSASKIKAAEIKSARSKWK